MKGTGKHQKDWADEVSKRKALEREITDYRDALDRFRFEAMEVFNDAPDDDKPFGLLIEAERAARLLGLEEGVPSSKIGTNLGDMLKKALEQPETDHGR